MFLRIFLTLLLLVAFTTAYGQNKYQERQSKYFVEAAEKEFSLTETQQVELTEFRKVMVIAFGKSQKELKAGNITKEERKAANKENSKAFNNAIIKLTGKNYKELAPFFKRMRTELKSVK